MGFSNISFTMAVNDSSTKFLLIKLISDSLNVVINFCSPSFFFKSFIFLFVSSHLLNISKGVSGGYFSLFKLCVIVVE